MSWLKPYALKERGKVLPNVFSKSSFDKRLRALRERTGWKAGEWPQNGLRRTFISCHYATYSNVGTTASIAGTSEAMIFNNYRAVMKKSLAQKLWAIVPTKKSNVIKLSA